MKIIILTGYSGSGKSSALRYIEEQGYYCVDNLPGKLLKEFVSIAEQSGLERIAVVIDARGKDFLSLLEAHIDSLKKKHSVEIVFIDSSISSITQRFQEHRLRHPLALKGTIRQGFEIEKKLLNSLRQKADLVLDSSGLSVDSLKALMNKYLIGEKNREFEVHLMSFGFKYGLPQEADLVIDVRPLLNPFFEPKLKNKNGRHAAVQKYILNDRDSREFIEKTLNYLKFWLARAELKKRPFVTVAFGCTGGKHRSVFVAEYARKYLHEIKKKATASHRDIKLD